MKINELKPPLKGSCHCGVIKFKINTNLRDLRSLIVQFVLEKDL